MSAKAALEACREQIRRTKRRDGWVWITSVRVKGDNGASCCGIVRLPEYNRDGTKKPA